MEGSVFLRTNHLFLRNPRGGVEDVAAMGAAGFGAIFCNIGDHTPEEWQTIRERAAAAGVACGPWLRTATAANVFDFDKFHHLLRVADEWNSPLIVNAESEIQGTMAEITTYIDAHLAERDAAISMEPWPFDNVEWWPLAERPMMPQLAKSIAPYTEEGLREVWHDYGIECVVLTFGSFGGEAPADYDRLTPYGIYTADDLLERYSDWGARGTGTPCLHAPGPTPPNGGDVKIGSQDGVTASINRLRDMDPGGTLLVKDAKGKWPKESIDTLTQPLDQWKAYDKLERALTILVEDHDAKEV